MRTLGHVLMWAGVLAASYVSVAEVATIAWFFYVLAVACGLVGVVLLRLTATSAAHHEHRISEDLATMRGSLSTVVRTLGDLADRGETIDVYGIKDRIDRELSEPLARFADARESMIPAFGLPAYAEVMSRFACGERMVNRAWSASADGYLDEVVTCLQAALGELGEAKGRYDHHQAARAQARAQARP